MDPPGRTPAIIVSGLIIVFGIIHFGAGIGIVAKYRQYQDIFRPSIGIGAFDIIIGLYAVGVGVLCLFGIIRKLPALSKTGAICSGVLGIVAIASLITALVINSQAVGYVRGRISYRMNTYIETGSSINVMDLIQTRYQCCGENLWLDWQRVGLGLSTANGVGTGTGTVTGTGTGTVAGTGTGTVTGTGTGTGTGTVVGNGRRRRRSLGFRSSPLLRVVRRRRQVSTSTYVYGLPATYTFNLPLSCCISGGVTSPNSIGGYCVFSASNGTTGFYVEGCIPPVATVMVVQITGIAIINMCLAILAIVLVPILINMFPAAFNPNNPNNKQHLSDQRQQEQQQQQQYPYDGSYGNYSVQNPPNMYYTYPEPAYITYQ